MIRYAAVHYPGEPYGKGNVAYVAKWVSKGNTPQPLPPTTPGDAQSGHTYTQWRIDRTNAELEEVKAKLQLAKYETDKVLKLSRRDRRQATKARLESCKEEQRKLENQQRKLSGELRELQRIASTAEETKKRLQEKSSGQPSAKKPKNK
jgi:hypothetical protein